MPRAKSQSNDEILQRLHDVESVLRKSGEQVKYFVALKNTSFLDGYREGKLTLILDLNVSLKRDDVRVGGLGYCAHSSENLAVLISNSDALDPNVRLQFQQENVFVRNIEFVKNVQNASLPSLVWLNVRHYQLKECWAGDVYFSLLKKEFELIPHGINREFSALVKVGKTQPFNRAYPSEIDGSVEIVDSISDNERKIQESIIKIWDRVFHELKSSITISLDLRSAFVYQRSNSDLQVRDMLIGPIDL